MTINFSNALIKQLVIHRVGSKLNEEGYFLSKHTNSNIGDDVQPILRDFFTSSFNQPEFNQFTHPTAPENNDIFQLSCRFFAYKDQFLEVSNDLAALLYHHSTHPKVKGGEMYVVHLSGVVVDGMNTEALGIYKSENKTPFMKVFHTGDAYDYTLDEGIDLHTIDKSCIILNVNESDGYRVCIHDRGARQDEARYWKTDFLGLKPCADSYNKTKQYMSLCKEFIEQQLPADFEVAKTDQIELLNRSVAFFKSNEKFDYDTFAQEVLPDKMVQESFDRYKNDYEQRNELELNDGFDISDGAVKNRSKFFKSVLKLDKNFHVYVHGNKEFIEQGFDEDRGLNYYKLFYREEA